MRKIKGFVNINNLISNNVGVTAPIGETTTYSNTYSKEKGQYFSNIYPGISLTTVLSFDTTLGLVPLTSETATHILNVSCWVKDWAATRSTQYLAIDLLNAMMLSLNGLVANVEIGEIQTNGDIWMPSWLSWENTTTGTNTIKVWFSDAAFRQQYDEFEIVVVPPVVNLDDFFRSPNELKNLIQARTPTQTTDLIAAARNKNPETILRAESFDFKAINIPNFTVSTTWYSLIYGEAGDNIDAVKEAIVNYILAHSTHSRAEWTQILPDLFKSTEFIILPRWDKYAIANMTLQAGMYSPVANPSESLNFASQFIVGYPELHVRNNVRSMGSPYKSLTMLVVGSPQNRDGKVVITDYFSDYIVENTNSPDFNRMSENTQQWMFFMEEMLIVAEHMTAYSDLPTSMRRIKRDNHLYVTRNFKGIQYLVAAKDSFGI
jgi:hypothetical protein